MSQDAKAVVSIGFCLSVFFVLSNHLVNKILDMKERIAKLEVKVEHLETNHE